jgi:osmotically inducible protein OsmC
MKLSFVLGEAGFTPDELNTECTIVFDDGVITESNLVLSAKVPGISKEKFDACVEDAELNCPISKLLKATISVQANLV